MSEKHEPFAAEIDMLRTLRDELRVQLNLAGKEARELFENAEKTWGHLEGRLRLVERESRKEAGGVTEAARALAKEIRDAYQRLRELL
jgi:hypothetical protein